MGLRASDFHVSPTAGYGVDSSEPLHIARTQVHEKGQSHFVSHGSVQLLPNWGYRCWNQHSETDKMRQNKILESAFFGTRKK